MWRLHYGTVIDNGTFFLLVEATGAVTGRYSPSPYAKRPEASYRLQVPLDRCQRIHDQLVASRYQEDGAGTGPLVLRPGEQTLDIKEEGRGDGLSRSYPLDQVPRALGPLRRELARLIAELQREGGAT